MSAGSHQQRLACTGTTASATLGSIGSWARHVAHEEARAKADQINSLLAYSTPGAVRERLAAILSEVRCLVAWQALDLGNVDDSWRHYENAKTAALESGLPAYEAHASAGQAFVLIDIGETASAAEVLGTARQRADRQCSRLIRAWTAAAHGEALAANNRAREILAAFDEADALLPNETTDPEAPHPCLVEVVRIARTWASHSVLLTLTDAVARPGLYEVPLGEPLGELVAARGGFSREPRGFLMGGFFARLLGLRAFDIPCGLTELGAEGNAEIASISGACCAGFISDHPGTTWKFSRKPQRYHAVRGLAHNS